MAIKQLRSLIALAHPAHLTEHERWRVQAIVTQILARFARDAGFTSASDVMQELVCLTAVMSTCGTWDQAAERCLHVMEFLISTKPSSAPKPQPMAPASVRRALALIDEQYANRSLTLRTIANHLEFTTWRAAHLFQKHVGDSFTSIVRRRRVIEAQRLLLHSSASMKAIADRVGFASPSQFSKAFKAICALSPTEFRERRRRPR